MIYKNNCEVVKRKLNVDIVLIVNKRYFFLYVKIGNKKQDANRYFFIAFNRFWKYSSELYQSIWRISNKLFLFKTRENSILLRGKSIYTFEQICFILVSIKDIRSTNDLYIFYMLYIKMNKKSEHEEREVHFNIPTCTTHILIWLCRNNNKTFN